MTFSESDDKALERFIASADGTAAQALRVSTAVELGSLGRAAVASVLDVARKQLTRQLPHRRLPGEALIFSIIATLQKLHDMASDRPVLPLDRHSDHFVGTGRIYHYLRGSWLPAHFAGMVDDKVIVDVYTEPQEVALDSPYILKAAELDALRHDIKELGGRFTSLWITASSANTEPDHRRLMEGIYRFRPEGDLPPYEHL